MNKSQEKLIQRTMDVQRELTREGLNRRNLMKLGVLGAGTGMLLPIPGLSLRAAMAAACPIPGKEIISPRVTPFKDPFRRMPELTPTYTVRSSVSELNDAMFLRGGKPMQMPYSPMDSKLKLLHEEHPEMAGHFPIKDGGHQAWDGTDSTAGCLAPPKNFYELRAIRHKHVWHSDLPAGAGGQLAWGFAPRNWAGGVTGVDGAITGVPGPVYRQKYGVANMIRMYNELPDTPVDQVGELGVGTSTMCTHMHNNHTPSESDGGPLSYNYPGHFWDYHYPNLYAGCKSGIVSPKWGVRGDYREGLGTLWYHDHKHDFTSQNVYAGLFGACPIYDEVDTGDETVLGSTNVRFPTHSQDAGSFPYEFDVPMILHDRQFDPNGVDFFPLGCFDGAMGDMPTVNGTIQPVMKVQPRRYRFRIISGGPSRFLWLWLSQGVNTATFVPMTVISNDGNLLPRAVATQSFKAAPGERMDVIIDFTGMKPGTEFVLTNRADSPSGRGPTGKLLPVGQGKNYMKFQVEATRPGLTDSSTEIVNGMPLRPLPDAVNVAGAKKKIWVWGRGNGAWNANGVYFDRYAAPYEIPEGSAEVWTHKNGGGSWSHPIHPHNEEFRILSRKGTATPNPTSAIETGRKDTLRLDPSEEAVTAMRFRDWKGYWPMHCHNTVHEDHGMMVLFKVV